MTFLALSGKDGVLPTRCELAGSGRGRVVKVLAVMGRARSSTHEPHPDPWGGEFDQGEIVGVVLFEAGRDGPGVFELVEEALDQVAVAV